MVTPSKTGVYTLTLSLTTDENVYTASTKLTVIDSYKEEYFKIIVSLYLECPQEENDTINIYNKIRTTHQRWYDADFDNFGIVPENFTHPFSNVSKEGLKMLGIDNCFIEHLEKGDQRLIDHGYILPEEIEPVFIFDYKKINGLEDHYQKSKCLQKKY